MFMAREHETRDWEFSFSVMVLVSRIFGTVFPLYPKGECMIPLSWALNWSKVCRQTNARHIQLYCTINEGQVNLLLLLTCLYWIPVSKYAFNAHGGGSLGLQMEYLAGRYCFHFLIG